MITLIPHEFPLRFVRNDRSQILYDKPIPVMKAINLFAALLCVTSSLAFTGCYTQLAGNDGGYAYTGHVYHAPRPVYSDTVRSKPAAVRYDTTMHGDTMFIDEHPLAAQADTGASGSGEEIVNNYYGTPSYWDGLYLGFGWPYHAWYSPWYPYYSVWDYGWGYPGFYPPYYDPFFGFGFGYSYFGYGGYGLYGHGYYGHGFYGGGVYGGYAYGGIGRPIIAGRVGGDYRMGNIASSQYGGRTSSIEAAGTQRGSSLTGAGASALRSGSLAPAADRNAPVHVTAPDANGLAARYSGAATSNAMAASSHTVVVRRSINGQSVTSSNVGGRQMTVVRRNANGSRGYSSGRGGGYGGY